jgi:hypothetical protein
MEAMSVRVLFASNSKYFTSEATGWKSTKFGIINNYWDLFGNFKLGATGRL